MWFRGDGFVDCGGRFPDIEQKVEFSVDNYVDVVTEAIKKSIKSKKVDKKYLEEKAKQEQQERENYYNTHKEELMVEDDIDAEEKEVQIDKEIQDKIKVVIKGLSVAQRNDVRAKLKERGLPEQYNKVTDIDILNKILATVSE